MVPPVWIVFRSIILFNAGTELERFDSPAAPDGFPHYWIPEEPASVTRITQHYRRYG